MTASTCSTGQPIVSSPPPPHVELEPGTRLGRYRLSEEIGRGSYAVVYQGRDTRLERDVALKAVNLGSETMTAREAQLLARIEHRHVVAIHDIVREGEVEALVLELVNGPSLSVLARRGAMPPEEVIGIGAQLAAGLEALHEAGVVHRDIKPSNLRLTADGVLKILDLGVACCPGCGVLPIACLTGGVGTVPYMSPERLQGARGDAQSDLWSAGAVLFELATGRRMVDVLSHAARQQFLNGGSFPDSWRLTPALPPPLMQIVARALEPDLSARYQSARELGRDLARLTEAAPSIAAASGMAAVA
jgi:serine/threonine-protein kinase